jgi:predicted RNA-binding Zn ribbon-like protein
MSISTVSLAHLQQGGFVMGGEPLVSIDLIDTITGGGSIDLLASQEQVDRWWSIQSVRLPVGHPPDGDELRRLRAVLRELFEHQASGTSLPTDELGFLNAVAASVPTSSALERVGEGIRVVTRFHPEPGAHAGLAWVAREAISFLGDEAATAQLRRCQNPTCSMMFIAVNSRRLWCAGNVCGNRARVARHYQRGRENAA